jgi:hypothetical protein
VRQQAEAALDDADGDRWPELANYDCYACHHHLRPQSWRQARGYRGKPGRPEVRSWSFALGQVGFALSAKDKNPTNASDLEAALSSWHRVFQEVPFGDPKAVVREAVRAERLLDEHLARLRAMKLDGATARAALKALLDLAQARDHDFESARQLAWGLRAITRELAAPKAVEEIISRLEKDLQLNLPEGQAEIAPRLLEPFYRQVSAYEPNRFREAMKLVADRLGD